MAKETRDAVVSVRLSAEEQERLRKLAEEEGAPSVSELIRRYVRRTTDAGRRAAHQTPRRARSYGNAPYALREMK